VCGFAVPSRRGWGWPLDLSHDKDHEQDHGEQGLAPRVAALEKLLTPVSHEGTAIFITGANLPMVHGLGQTDCGPEDNLILDGPNGLGSPIVASNDPRVGGRGRPPAPARTSPMHGSPPGRYFLVRWRNRSSGMTFVLLNVEKTTDCGRCVQP
jgi:hypothetical protein